MTTQEVETWQPTYEPWRHGGWYVTNVRYPSGACGCVSRNYPDKKWRIVCDSRPFDLAPTFPNRDAAARAEYEIASRYHLTWTLDEAFKAGAHDRKQGREPRTGDLAWPGTYMDGYRSTESIR